MIYLNSKLITPTMFPDNTSQIWQIPENIINQQSVPKITWEFSHEGEIMQIAQLVDLIESFKLYYPPSLVIKYLPYGRQDKEVSNSTTFALYSFAKIINNLLFSSVSIIDPHSNIALDLINNSRAIYPQKEIDQILTLTETNWVCYPDKGAVSKYSEIYKYPYLYGEKVRDQLSGNILSYSIEGNPVDKKILIIDDICDGGMTFKLLAQELLKAGAKEVNLFVSHGLFTKGLKTLTESGINRVFTPDGEIGETQNNITHRRL